MDASRLTVLRNVQSAVSDFGYLQARRGLVWHPQASTLHWYRLLRQLSLEGYILAFVPVYITDDCASSDVSFTSLPDIVCHAILLLYSHAEARV